MKRPLSDAKREYEQAFNILVERIDHHLSKAETIDRIVESINKKQIR
jgi:hypothetical protein